MSCAVLAVAPKRDALQLLGPLLSRDAFEVHEMPTATASLILTNRQRYNLLLVGYPLPDMPLGRFLSAVHGLESRCASSPVLILGDEKRLAEARPFVEGGYVQALATGQDRLALEEAAAKLLAVSPRLGVRAMVRLEVDLDGGTTVQLAQTRNISEEGMFIVTGRDLKLGDRLPVRLYLPGESQSIAADVEVTRRALPEVEGVAGVGVRFWNVSPGDQQRLRRHIGAVARGSVPSPAHRRSGSSA